MIIQADQIPSWSAQGLRSGLGAPAATTASARLASGLGLAAGDSVRPGSLPGAAPQTLGRTTADEIVRRMEAGPDEEGRERDATALRDSLAATLDWVRERFGNETGAAASGMLMAATADTVSEETLGQGLLDTLRFIDRNQGFAAGDEAIARFNAGVNGQLNAYFDNGRSEQFMAVQVDAGDTAARSFLRSAKVPAPVENIPNLAEALLESLRQDLDETVQLQGAADPALTPGTLRTALAAYGAVPADALPQLVSLTA
ncbi:hypothetical protein GKC30_07115 [Pseudodesulfovibrio sp. F-1]|uniref:Uncharacterized protein n=1 Tax=Pseudodesulfovibrio alkaliphilus TaxID=2661613 RepID=A0A7K1KMS8_9BACT|nr:hypothetical protein [Pseudodesulfovibrio alkaliphilus]MUM77396.1 hypothetical protein [Pseudodesulfovibrio alkaliphilus]